MRIGDQYFPLGLVLAPMAGFTDASFRLLCRRLGAELTVTEMVSAAALCFRDTKTARLARLPREDTPAAVQLFGHDPDGMRRAAGMIASGGYEGCCTEARPALIDLNMGCPVKKIVSAGDGSALMRTPALAGELVRAAVREALPPEIPVIGNGDVTTAEDCLRLRRQTGCDGVAVGRAALGDPWIFAAVRAAAAGEEYTPPTEEKRRRTAYELASAVIAAEGEGAVRECRGRIAHFIRGMRGAAEMRAGIHRAESLKDIKAALSLP